MFQKTMKSFNIDNKSAYYYDFWRSCDTAVMMLKIQRYITEINYILKHIKKGNQYYIGYFWSNKYSLDEQKRLLKT